jgi:hypothetical protein
VAACPRLRGKRVGLPVFAPVWLTSRVALVWFLRGPLPPDLIINLVPPREAKGR